MAVTLEDIQRELARRQATPVEPTPSAPTAPAQPPAMQGGITLQDVRQELARRETIQPAQPPEPPRTKSAIDYLLMGAFGPTGGRAVKETIAEPGKRIEEFRAAGGGPLPVMGGEALGRLAGAPLGPPGVFIGGALGAGAGELGRQMVAGEDLDFKKALIEAGFSAGTGAVFEGLGMAGRKLLSRTKTGTQTGEKLAAEKIRKEAPQLLKPKPREQVSQMFDEVTKSGVKIAPQGVDVSLLDDDQFRILVREIKQIPAGPDFPSGFGGRMAKQLEAIRQGAPAGDFEIGELQQLRSQLMKRAASRKEGAVQDVLSEAARIMDQGVEAGRVTGPATAEVIDQLKEARRQWRVIRQSDDLSNLARSVTRRSKGNRLTMHVGRLQEALEEPQRGMAAKAAAVLRERPEAKQALQQMVSRFETLNIEGGGLGGGIIERAADTVLGFLAAPAARERFMRLVEGQRGTITFEQLTLLANQARREVESMGLGAGGSEASFLQGGPAYPPQR